MNNKIEAKSIWYNGVECFYNSELETIDEAQSIIDYFTDKGLTVCCLHLNNKHQLYIEKQIKRIIKWKK